MVSINDLAFLIKSFERPHMVDRCIDSIRDQWPAARIYVFDDSRKPRKFDGVTASWTHTYDGGVCYGRNELIRRTGEPYIVQVDDDYIFTDKADVLYLARLLESHNDYVLAGCKCRHRRGGGAGWTKYYGDVYFEGTTLNAAEPSKPVQEFENRAFRQVDVISNFWVAKRRLFESVMWDERFVIGGEHADFFLRLQVANGDPKLVDRILDLRARRMPGNRPLMPRTNEGMNKVAFVPSLWIDHEKSRPGRYKRLRKRDVDGERLFRMFWNISRVKRWRKEPVKPKPY